MTKKPTPPEGPPAEIVEVLVAGLRRGLFRSVAASLAGINRKTLHRWLKYAEAGDQRFKAVAEAIEKAEAEFQDTGLAIIQAAADATDERGKVVPGAWKAQAWLFEKRFPKRFGSRAKVEHSGEVVTRPFAGKSDAELDAIIAGADTASASTLAPDDDDADGSE